MNITDAKKELDATLRRGEVREALGYLNGLTGHRYTALYRFDDPVMRNLFFYDRESPETVETDDFPVEVTYCVYVRESGRPFVVEDAMRDLRIEGHPSRRSVQAYCGVPLVDDQGLTVGTLCHFDSVPVQTNPALPELMEVVAPLFARRAISKR